VSAERWAEDYERGRPGWPAAAVAAPGLSASAHVLELGAGTGKLTRLLVQAFARVVAVEPAPEMRRLLVHACPEVEVLAAGAESIPVPDASFDGVFAAECFHVFDADAAVAEIARVLRPSGALVLLWNVPAGPTDPPIDAAEQLLRGRAPDGLGYDPVDLNTNRYASGAWRSAFTGAPFEAFREESLPNPQVLDREALVAFFSSMGWIGWTDGLPDDERVALLDEVRTLLDDVEHRQTWETRVHWTRRAH